MNSKEARFEYKCRRCNAVTQGPFTAEHNGLTVLLGAIYENQDILPAQLRPQAPKLLGAHLCVDQGMGVSDLLGYVVVKR